jgi:uncharacterized protein
LRSSAALPLILAATGAAGADIVAVDFTSTPAPATDADMVRTYTASEAVVRYSDGTTESFPLAYTMVFKNTDSVGGPPAAQLFDVEGEPLVDMNGDPIIAETPDANSLLDVDGELFMVTHYEYEGMLADGNEARHTPGW